MSNYKTQELVNSGFNFNTIFVDKQEELKKHSGFNFGLQEIALLIGKQTNNYQENIPIAHDIDDALYGVYLKWKKTQEPEVPKDQPKEEPKSKAEEQIEKLEKSIKSVKLAMKVIKNDDDKKFASEKLALYEKLLKKLQSKKEQGGDLIISTTHSVSDPKENTDPTVEMTFSQADPKKETGGILDEVIKVRNVQSGKISNWTVKELLERINEDNATDDYNYDENDWLEGFNETLTEFYSLNDEDGKPLNDLSKYSKGGGFDESYKARIKKFGFKPYGKEKGRFIVSYLADGEMQEEIWMTKEMAVDQAKRYSKLFGQVNIKDPDGNEVKFDKGGGFDKINEELEKKYSDWEYPIPPVYTGNWTIQDWSNWIEKNGRKKHSKGGGFEKLAKHVAKEYEGHKVAPEYQKDYGKKYSHEEAVEVGKKVAAKVYRQQLAKKN